MVAADDIGVLSRFLHVVLCAELDMVSQSVVRLCLVLVESIDERSVVFRAQVGSSERYIPAEENLVVQLSGTRSAYANTNALEHVPAYEVVYRTDIELTLVQVSRRSRSHIFGGDGIHRRYQTGDTRVSRRFMNQVIYGALIACERFRTKCIPRRGTEPLSRRVVHLHLVGGESGERLAWDRCLQVPVGIDLRLTGEHTSFVVQHIEFRERRRSVRRP